MLRVEGYLLRLNSLVKVKGWSVTPEEARAWEEVDRCEGRITVIRAAIRAAKIFRAKKGSIPHGEDYEMEIDRWESDGQNGILRTIRENGGSRVLDVGAIPEHGIKEVAMQTFNSICNAKDVG